MTTSQKPQFTQLESLFIDKLIKALFAEPGFTDVDIKELSEKMNISVHSAKGILGSLVKKGVCETQKSEHNDFVFAKQGRKIVKVKKEKFELICLHPDYYYLHPVWSKSN